MATIPDRTSRTEAVYDRRARQIIARIDSEVWISQHRRWRPDDLPNWLAAMAASLAHASWRQYKAALVAFAEGQSKSDARWQPASDRLAELRWFSPDNHLARRRPLRTSARKEKAPHPRRLEQLQAWLAFHSPVAAAFLLATSSAGLRPAEWAGASFEGIGDRWRLSVRNAKATNGRSHGAARTLWFDGLDFRQITAIRRTISAFRLAATSDALDPLQERIERAFRAGNKALWPRRKRSITPYSMRHVFAARVKLAYRPEEVAALMGHATDATAFHHYGRRK